MLFFPLFNTAAQAREDDAWELVYEANSEKLLRELLKIKYPNCPVEKFKNGDAEVICVMPRLKGGGSGVRSILVYCGSDQEGGWGLRLNCATFFTEIATKVDHGFLVFTGAKTNRTIIKVSMSFGVFDEKGHAAE